MIRAVLDCNVVITAALTGGKCADLLASATMVPTDLLPAIDVVKADPSDNVYPATAVAGGAR